MFGKNTLDAFKAQPQVVWQLMWSNATTSVLSEAFLGLSLHPWYT
jgi:hypothetical protein